MLLTPLGVLCPPVTFRPGWQAPARNGQRSTYIRGASARLRKAPLCRLLETLDVPVGGWLLHDGANSALTSMAVHRGIQLIIVARSPEAAAELHYRYGVCALPAL